MIEHYSHKIQNAIQKELFKANSSIKIAVAWFTNDLLFQPLLLKLGAGVSVELILNKDEINCSADNEVDFDEFVNAGGVLRWNDSKQLMHDKFCIIDNRIVITGSYNWTNKAEYNSEVESFFYDEKETTQFYNELYEKLSLRFEQVKSVFKNNIEEVSDTMSSSDEGFFIDEYGVKYSTDRKRLIKVPGNELRIVYANRPPLLYSSGKCPTSYRIPDGVTSIEDYAFSVCTSLKSIYIPNSVKSIGKCAFEECHSLTTIHIPDSVSTIGERAFYGCEDLESIRLSESLNEISDETFFRCKKLKHINIPNSVTCIGDRAFGLCINLVCINIPDSVIAIKEGAFCGCERLISIHLPNNITSIEKETFSLCRRLRSIIIPNRVTSIGENAFWNTDLTSINIPESVTSIGNGAIVNTRIGTIYILVGTKSKFEEMTSGWNMCGLKIVEYYGIDDLLKIVYDYELENAWTDEFGAKYSQDRKRLLKAPTNDISNYSIRNGTKVICNSAFYQCFKLTSVHIPDSVTCIGTSAFSGCQNLTSLYIPDSVLDISSLAFNQCWKLTSIRLPNNLTSIGNVVFGSCKNIKSISLPKSVIRIGKHIFVGCDNLPTVYIPVGTRSKFEKLLPKYKDKLVERL